MYTYVSSEEIGFTKYWTRQSQCKCSHFRNYSNGCTIITPLDLKLEVTEIKQQVFILQIMICIVCDNDMMHLIHSYDSTVKAIWDQHHFLPSLWSSWRLGRARNYRWRQQSASLKYTLKYSKLWDQWPCTIHHPYKYGKYGTNILKSHRSDMQQLFLKLPTT